MRIAVIILVVFAVQASANTVLRQSLCPAVETNERTARINPAVAGGVRLVARLEDPPRTRVTLSIDNERGNHYELVWDPATHEGLQKEVLLPEDPGGWQLTPQSEYERVQAEATVFTYATEFKRVDGTPEILFQGTNTVSKAGENGSVGTQGSPRLKIACREAQTELPHMILDKRRVTAAAKARGLLDAAVPEKVETALSLLAEIALDRAKNGAFALLRDKFVSPTCEGLRFENLGFQRARGRVLPRTCTLLENLRLQDVLSSGRALLGAIETDIRETLLDEVIAHLPSLNEQGQSLARLALRLAGRAVDGQLDGLVEIDYLITLLDQMSWATGFDRDVERVQAWASTVDPKIVLNAVDAVLPTGFDAPIGINQRPWGKLNDCRPRDVRPLITGTIYYKNADRAKCIAAIAATLGTRSWLADGIARNLFTLDQVIATARRATSTSLGEWLQQQWQLEVEALQPLLTLGFPVPGTVHEYVHAVVIPGLPSAAQAAVDASCASRLVVGIAKWCSSQESCAAGEVAAMLKDPTKVFRPTATLPWSMCWTSATEYRVPKQLEEYIDLGVRLVAFLNPPAKGDERRRILAMIRWMFDVVASVASPDRRQLSRMHDVVEQLVERDYIGALTTTIAVASELRLQGRMPPQATRALQLIGAVASYSRTYEETKTLDPAAAREARRKALEAIIDSATDRRERGREWIWSLGSNVGAGLTAFNVFNKNDDQFAAPEIALRLPLSISTQFLPLGSNKRRDEFEMWRYVGLHASLQFADVGQFARETANDVTWATFVSPGLEVGVLLGEPHRAISVSVHGSYVPALAEDTPPMWRFGIALGYYVPFFDFN